MCQTPSPNAVVALGVETLTCENGVCIDPIVSSLEGKQLATQAGFPTHLASQCLTVVIKLFHGHRFPSTVRFQQMRCSLSSGKFRKTASNLI